MSNPEFDALENSFRIWKEARMADAKDSDAFETFSTEQILKDADLSDEDIAFGKSGGGGDGGVDGYFFFIDRKLVHEDNFVPTASISAELTLIQSTLTAGFDEKKIDKLEKFCRYLLDWNDLTTAINLRQTARDNMMRFRKNYTKLLSHDHVLNVNLHYASRSVHPPSSNVLLRAEELKSYIKSKLPLAEVKFVPWGSAKLLQAVRATPQRTLVLDKVKDFSMPDKSVVCICTVASYANFLDNGKGELRTWLMEPNVRDYQGSNPVNKQIRGTLNRSSWTEDFWWLNNGVTILSDACSVTGDQVRIENPEVVNGLQTSYEIFKARNNSSLSKQHVLVKVIVAMEDRAKNAIIKATNSQTTVSLISLNATEPIQFDIEDKLLRHGLFYDRRKGKYRMQKKPIKNIVSIKALAQAIIAAYLQLPSDSRARPDSLMRSTKHSPVIFNESHGLDFFAACILIDRKCADYLQSMHSLFDDQKVDLRYYVTMLAACELCGVAHPDAKALSETLPYVEDRLVESVLLRCLEQVKFRYDQLGGNDRVAKGRDLEDHLKSDILSLYPPS